MKITILHDDITRQDVDAIVNPANSYGFMGGGVAEAIKKIGGEEIELEAASQAPIPLGSAIISAAGTLRCRHVIHSPTVEQPGGNSSPGMIVEETLAALHCADENQLARIAFPGLGTGVGGVDKEQAAKAMLETIANLEPKCLQEILLVDTDEEMVIAWKNLFFGGKGKKINVKIEKKR